MNMQNLMAQAQKMQRDYEYAKFNGTSSKSAKRIRKGK